MSRPELIVMLTKDDLTVENASHIFEACKHSDANVWGLKEKGLPLEQMKQLFASFKSYGKTGVLEVVSYTEEEGLSGAHMAAECGCDILLGTMFYDSINAFCKKHGLKYMPFVGKVKGRPSVLEGTAEHMVAQAKRCLAEGVYGFDLLGYRYQGDAERLMRTFISEVQAPVCVAGSINSYERLDQIADNAPAFFTVGGAFFDRKFGEDFCDQINRVYHYMK